MPRRHEFRNSGTNPRYDFWYDSYRYSSDILHNRNTFSLNLSDTRGCQNALASIIGNSQAKPGHYRVENAWKIALLPSLELDEKVIELAWSNYQQSVVNSGRRQPTAWPDELAEQKARVMARIDITRDEISAIEKKLTELQASEVAEANEFLKYGPQGNSRGGTVDGVERAIIELDGQAVSVVNGIPTITEPTSPYVNMCTADFFDFIVPAWRKQKKEQDAQLLIRLQSEAKEKGLPIPTETPVSTSKRVSRSSLPRWEDFPDIKPNLPQAEEGTDETEPKKPKKDVQLF